MKRLILVLMVLTVTSAVFAQEPDFDAMYILFAPNSASLRAVSAAQAVENVEVFTEVARILVENPQFRLLIDGHANAVLRTNREEVDRLRPLSRQRAEAAADFLVENYRIGRHRLIISNGGGRYPTSTEANLNRRVNFYFIIP